MNPQHHSTTAFLRPCADVNTTPTPGANVLTPYRADDVAASPLYLGIAVLIAFLAALCLWAFMDASLLATSPRTRLDLDAAACPRPAAGQHLIITVVSTGDGHAYAATCSTIKGRSA